MKLITSNFTDNKGTIEDEESNVRGVKKRRVILQSEDKVKCL